jgi:taurine dioxygenase
MTSLAESITVRRLSDALGAEVIGVDLSRPVDNDTFGLILEQFRQHLVLVFRRQALTPGQQVAFTRRFGELEIHVSRQYTLPEQPEILLLTNEIKDGKRVSLADGGSEWHSDLSYLQEPSLGSLLFSVRNPEQGGDTEWQNLYLAYETLPEETRARIADLKAIHQFDQSRNPRMSPVNTELRDKLSDEVKARTPDAIHPVVRTHPETGRKSLFVSPRFTIGIADMDDREGQELLDELFAHLERPEFVYHHKWQDGDAVLWDNRCLNHKACGGVVWPDLRRMHRTTIRGDVPY